MPFELLTKTEATLTTFTGRVETHGKTKVSAVSFRLLFSGPNTLLDKLSQTARKTFYMAAEGQEDLPGFEPTTPHLRSRDIKRWSPENAYEGWTVTVDRTGNEEDDIELGGCKIDGFDCELHDDPGNVDIELRVGTHHLTPDEAGYLWSKQQHKVFVMLAAPLTQQTNPDVGQVETDERQLTLDGTTGEPVGEASPARQAAEAVFAGEPIRGDDWPFPRPGQEGDAAATATEKVLEDVAKHGPGDTATAIAYQDADKPSRTWTGNGKMPTWLKQALAMGKTLADFQVKAH
jgi:hypothetical protein